jgi:site-specific DNA recombinase
MIKGIKNVAIYNRISRDTGENEDTLLSHRNITTRICEEKGYIYTLYEEILSGGKIIEDRPKMIQLLNDINNGLFDALVVVEITRLSRDLEYSQRIAKILAYNDVPVITQSKNYDLTDESDRFSYNIESVLGERELAGITLRYRRGKIERARRGEWIQGVPPLGYIRNVVTKKLEIVEPESKIVKYIFDLAENGYGISNIVKQLTMYKTRDGNNFNISSVNKILSNTTYTGTITYNVKDKKGNITEPITSIDSHEPIIPLSQFNNVQSAIKGRISGDLEKRNRSKGECISILKDLLYCDNCGLKLGIRRDSKYKDKIYVNKCNCGNKGIAEDKLLTEFWEELASVEKQLRLTFQRTLEKSTNEPKEFLLHSIEELNKKEQKANTKLKRIRDAYTDEIFTKEEYLTDKIAVEKELSLINSSKSELTHKLNLLDTETISNEYETKLKWLDDIRKLSNLYDGKLFVMGKDLKDAPSPKVETKDIAEVNRLLKLVIEKVYYHRYNGETNLFEDGYVDIEKGDFIKITVSPKQ